MVSDRRLAWYPFLTAARAAVAETDTGMLELIREEAVLERGIERVTDAITDGDVSDPMHDRRAELLSYPVARIIVSVVDDETLTERYAGAEAARGIRLLKRETDARGAIDWQAIIGGPSTDPDDGSVVRAVAGDLELLDPLEGRAADRDELGVTRYLQLTADLGAERWRLVGRSLAAGWVPVTDQELTELLEEAIRRQVVAELPLAVPERIETAIEPAVQRVETAIADVPIPNDITTFEPAAIPPCFAQLADRIRTDEAVTPIGQFVVFAFLTAIGLDADEVIEYLDVPEAKADAIREQVRRVNGGVTSTAYPPPDCDTMDSMGLCVDHPNRCDQVGHGLAAYQRRMESGLGEE